ncbi:hypothetical protein R1Y80_24660 [Streptomyces sp. JL1001]|uniref:M15 family metallopeptidase n=1 Tax=Streptomyces sp. JL1001 TaxID=3078227 RepID=A0AAU8KLX1_9ACTN|nr:hypothetical protein [Streptomyces sp. CB02613]PJN28559.1 hypothetical protein CG717_24740 [Streptomyces sp. CB02613]
MRQHGNAAPHTPLHRRQVVAGFAAIGGAALWSATGGAGAAVAAPTAGRAVTTAPSAARWSGAHSANGWPVVERAPEHRVEGAGGTRVTSLDGDVTTVLLHLVRRYHYEVRALGPRDITGHTTDRVIGPPYESNHLSGTAIALFPDLYPAGAKGNVFPQDLATLRDILAELDGVVAWGGDQGHAKESHFQIAVAPGDKKLAEVAARVRAWGPRPGAGAGVLPDVFATERRTRARDVRDRQNHHSRRNR